jgi:hypothetical protein
VRAPRIRSGVEKSITDDQEDQKRLRQPTHEARHAQAWQEINGKRRQEKNLEWPQPHEPDRLTSFGDYEENEPRDRKTEHEQLPTLRLFPALDMQMAALQRSID